MKVRRNAYIITLNLSGACIWLLFGMTITSHEEPIPPLLATCPSVYTRLTQQLKQAELHSDLPSTLLLLSLLNSQPTPPFTVSAEYNLCHIQFNNHFLCAEHKGFSRLEMPQLGGVPLPGTIAASLPRTPRGEVDAKELFITHLIQDAHYQISEEHIPLLTLKATQREIVGTKVAAIWLDIQDEHSPAAQEIHNSYIIISNDAYILDGHHRWMALVADALRRGTLSTATIRVKRVHAPILVLIQEAKRFAHEIGIQNAPGIS